MDESDSLHIIGEEENGDEFYEKIEAPKFVDLTAPDPYHPGDDRYWFCSRFGCDQKHEEEMDSEAIYRNFVLRVMAARSPNVRLRKALYRKDSGTQLKCPRTVPAKHSRSRVSRMALISSISKRIVDPKVKVKPLSKQSATPNAKTKQSSSVAKALTTQRTKKKLSNPDAFRSVRNTKTTAVAVPKNRVVAKTLVFHSPMKSVRIKSSLELNSPVRKLCAGMKKLEITSAKKQVLGYPRLLPPDAAKKQLRGREVKSRVFDGLRSQNHKGVEAKSSKCVKKNNKEKNLGVFRNSLPHEKDENDFSGKEIEDKRENGSEEVCSTSKIDEGNVNEEPLTIEVSKPSLDENKVEAPSDAINSDTNSLSNSEWRSPEDDDKRHSSTSHDKENDNEVMENDDKENASASDDNRETDLKTNNIEHDIQGKHETPKGNLKRTEAKSKHYKESSTTAATSAQGLKHKKPKPTNPKPFRLRTDERGILKEANLEKKLCPAPLGEITPVPRVTGGNSQKKHQNTLKKNGKLLEQTENHDSCEDIQKETNRAQRDQCQKESFSLKISKEKVGQKISSTPQRHTISSQRKLVASKKEHNHDNSSLKLGNSSRRTKSTCIRQLARTQGSIVTTGQLGTIKETSPTILKAKEAAPTESGADASLVTKGLISPASRPSLQGKRFKTLPKEPNFHTIHVPKSCTKVQITC
ncbi:uncharacterized protein LOC110619667 isoform X2 [Manihot esculenta]|uniref:Uncharacterized protein n=1 Tax=Manihot esculenta TaxID=3983 RepID=A0A2C9VK75_MANES|nr:uncharacterized protein LOC110619667 isoform X2 [Manihot esculenta]OAY45305.1 hypothetical protein MANES_07G049500v8 [Manihot esculenta]